MHYIRFLKHPKLTHVVKGSKKRWLLKALITVTTDLGESFFGEDVTLLMSVRASTTTYVFQQKVNWGAIMRELAVTFEIPVEAGGAAVHLLVAPLNESYNFTSTEGVINLPIVVPVMSDNIGIASEECKTVYVSRCIPIRSSEPFDIWEEGCNSIARHIWDAAMVLVAYLDRSSIDTCDDKLPALHKLLKERDRPHLRVIELGAGCGLAGLAVARIISNCNVTLTDTAEVQDLIENWNIPKLPSAIRPNVHFEVLHWEGPLPPVIRTSSFDLILITDCIYNPDSSPALVKTITTLVEASPQALIVNASKTRHSDEAIFFKLMDQAGFVTLSRTHVTAAMGYAKDALFEIIDICVFQWHEKNQHGKNFRNNTTA